MIVAKIKDPIIATLRAHTISVKVTKECFKKNSGVLKIRLTIFEGGGKMNCNLSK
jgi:hypothetical protein